MVDGDGRLGSIGYLHVAVVVVGVVVGALAVPYVLGGVAADDQYVVVVDVDGPITGDSADAVTEELRSARQNDSVAAVVLRVHSPGGGAGASESQYLAVRQVAAQKPVVTSVAGQAASGAYYTILPSDRIYTTPGSTVGSVGVRADVPAQGLPSELTTGPDKASIDTPDRIRAHMETINRGFVGAVVAERGDALSLTSEEVAHAKAYSGAEAVDNGMADAIGGTDAAIDDAADRAGIEDYEVVYRDPGGDTQSLLGLEGNASDPFGPEGVQTVRYLMLYGSVEGEESVTVESTGEVDDDE